MNAEILREPVAESWRRATLAGLEPGSALDRIDYVEIDRRSSLLAAAAPVLDELNGHLHGTTFSTLLVDRDGRVAHRWCGDNLTRRAFDNIGIDVGASLLEEVVGTNAPGTVLETRSSIVLNGGEHFAVPLRRFSCYGHPIFHPATRRIEGVLDLSALLAEAHPLLPPLVARAVQDIEQRLLDRSRVSDKQLLAAFQAVGNRRRPVVAVGHDLQIANQAALDLVGPTDQALLRMLAADLRDQAQVEVTLESGQGVRVWATRIGGAQGGALLELEVHHRVRATPVPAAQARPSAPVVVSGPPGSGRSTRARLAAGTPPVTVLTGASALLDGPESWVRDFGAITRSRQGSLVIDGLEQLSDDLLELVAHHIETGHAPRVVLVTGSVDDLVGRAAALVGDCAERIVLPPLVSQMAELPELVGSMLKAVGADESLHFTPGAMRALACQPWPGNLRELRAVVDSVLSRRGSGGVVLDDLPAGYRSVEPIRPMAPIERAERDVIISALREHDGNKVRTAESLGISRTTLYAKMRALRITVY